MLLTPSLPLVLDLDGTLIRTDTFHEMMACLLVTKPWVLFLLPFWLLKGRSFAKARLAKLVDLSPPFLPYNPSLLAFAKKEALKGRPLILATGTNQKVAQSIADYLGFFQDVIGSNDTVNMTGSQKQQALLERFGAFGFDYAGDSRIDYHVWQVAHKALVVHPKWQVLNRVRTLKDSDHIHFFPREIKRISALFQSMRPFFWINNLLMPSWSLFIIVSFLTSGLFIGGDLLRLSQEREKGSRSSIFAKGHLHLITAFVLTPLLALPSLLFLAFSLPWGILFTLIYLPLFVGLDILTRPLPQTLRWLFLSLFQLLTCWTLSI